MTRAEILDKAKECVCGQREQDYGKPEDNFATIAELWSVYKGYPFTASDVAMMMALLKIARIKTGASTDDCFVDLAGYASCGGEIMAKCREQGYEEATFTIPSPSKSIIPSNEEMRKFVDSLTDLYHEIESRMGKASMRAQKENAAIKQHDDTAEFKIGHFQRWDIAMDVCDKIYGYFTAHDRLSVCDLIHALTNVCETHDLIMNEFGGRRIANPCYTNRLYGWENPLDIKIVGCFDDGYTLITSKPKKLNQNKEED